MKKIIILLSIITFSNLGCRAQKKEDRVITNFNQIELAGTVNVFFKESDTLKLSVSADSKEIAKVTTSVTNGRLSIMNKGNFNSPVNVYVYAKNLKSLNITGATEFTCLNQITSDSLNIDLTGSPNVHVNTKANYISVTQSGAAELTLKGSSKRLQANVSGASELKAYGMQIENVEIITTGASTAKINVNNKLNANASGASTIKIKGDVKEVYAESSSAATIKRIESKEPQKNTSDTTTFKWGNKKVIVIGDEKDDDEKSEVMINDHESSFKHWRGIYTGTNGYFNATGGTNMLSNAGFMELKYSRSFNSQFNFIERHFNLHKNYFKVVTGMGLDFHRYELAKKTNLAANSFFTSGNIDTSNAYNYKRNALRTTYLQVPLLLEFNTSAKSSKSFHLALGVIGEFLLFAKTQQKLEQNNYKITKARSDDFNLNPFVAKAHLNFGYANWTLYAEYNLSPLFERNKGVELYPFNAGIRIIPFG